MRASQNNNFHFARLISQDEVRLEPLNAYGCIRNQLVEVPILGEKTMG